ncbi:hypothetical protein [Magnetospirillum aberrantis]|uniref:Uncharacterized protein n=1 Tax=Magnetospirillum aberrantis SpK TaxID=908842 RepID=A0A7C9QRP8_9PROT|nr:hypothetical protein [Magnetospirillum aberrantis]NFV78842.1 hypothetical protein [Magnetospirillum aberrantis SpK]
MSRSSPVTGIRIVPAGNDKSMVRRVESSMRGTGRIMPMVERNNRARVGSAATIITRFNTVWAVASVKTAMARGGMSSSTEAKATTRRRSPSAVKVAGGASQS